MTSPVRRNLVNPTLLVAIPSDAVSITAESDALAALTVANWLDVQTWRFVQPRVGMDDSVENYFEAYSQFDLDIEGDAAETITGASLYAVRLAPVTIADDTFTSSGSDNINTAVGHGMVTGDGPFQLTTTNTLPAPFELLTDYYAESLSANTFALHTSRADAISGAAGVVTTDSGTGTHTIADVQGSASLDDDTRRCRLALVTRLNSGAATIGTIVVGSQVSYVERIAHSPLNLYYALVATETSAQTLTVRATPIMETFQ